MIRLDPDQPTCAATPASEIGRSVSKSSNAPVPSSTMKRSMRSADRVFRCSHRIDVNDKLREVIFKIRALTQR
jgi:hypothetical protein